MCSFRKKQKNFLERRDSSSCIFRERNIMLFLDFDGTLAAIVDHYKKATILQESKMLLKKIAECPECFVAIVSGRALSDVKKRVGLKNVIYVGNHGLELEGPGIRYTSFVKTGVKVLFRKIKFDLVKRVKKVKGVSIEDKGLTLSVHYRRVGRKDLILFEQMFSKSMWPYLMDGCISINKGKKVFEIKPAVKWNKGSAVLWLLKHFRKNGCSRKMLPIFIGDDVTDETAFIALKNKGLCIRVGCGETSAAQYCLRNINQVTHFLRAVLDSQKAASLYGK
ncbi:MAG TPA: trehalose-phosphatase [Candidatus Omnitrophota bacterium]|nr:trehalose-phosphatase [Candidatus Omnitrophota bacterium]HPD84435.1 trehalose-phosphatase [Candidatus Omnitrophota bacterium]HRZ03293.1 trehalose-phosphatase [Candidatus Omnitrophota bacterium]